MSKSDKASDGLAHTAPYFAWYQKVLMGLVAILTGGAGGALLGFFVLTAVIMGSNPVTVAIVAGLVGAVVFGGIALLVMVQVERWWKRKQVSPTDSQKTQAPVPDSRPTQTPTPSIRPAVTPHNAPTPTVKLQSYPPTTPWRDVRELPPVSIGYDFAFAPQNDERAEALFNQAKERFKAARATELVGIKAFVANTNMESSVFSEADFIKEAESVLEKLEHCFIEGCVISLIGVANNIEGKAVLESLLKNALKNLRIESASDRKEKALRPYYDALMQSLSKLNDECVEGLKSLQQAFVEGRMAASVFVGELHAFEMVKVKHVTIPGYDESLWELRKQFDGCVAEYVEKASQMLEIFKLKNSEALALGIYDHSPRYCALLRAGLACVRRSRQGLSAIKAASLLKKEAFNDLKEPMYKKYYELLNERYDAFFELIKSESNKTEAKEEAGIAARTARKEAEKKANTTLGVAIPSPESLSQQEAVLQQSVDIISFSPASNVVMFSAPVDQQSPKDTASLPTAENSTRYQPATYQQT